MNLNKETMRKLKELIVFTIVLLIALWKYTVVLGVFRFLLGIVFPFLLGGAIAFGLNVPMSFFERKIFGNEKVVKIKKIQRAKRPLSLVLTILSVLGVIGLVLFVVIPELGSTFVSLGSSIQRTMPKLIDWLTNLFNNNKEIVTLLEDLDMNWDKIMNGVISFFRDGAQAVLDSTFSIAKNIISSLTTFFIAVVFACYILLQKEKLRVQMHKILFAYLPKQKAESILAVCALTYKTFSNFLTGQCVEALILGTMFFVTMSVIRLPYALLVGVLIAFTALIPIFGAFIGCVVGAFLILMVNPMKAVVFVIMFLILQQLEGNFIYPKVVGNSVGLPSIWVLAAVSIGGSLLGVVGMLVFIPLVSVVYTIFRGDVYSRLAKKGVQIDISDEKESANVKENADAKESTDANVRENAKERADTK